MRVCVMQSVCGQRSCDQKKSVGSCKEAVKLGLLRRWQKVTRILVRLMWAMVGARVAAEGEVAAAEAKGVAGEKNPRAYSSTQGSPESRKEMRKAEATPGPVPAPLCPEPPFGPIICPIAEPTTAAPRR
eukprot:COSAG05_NODE_6325_length_980_cov_1.586833_1_plen_129_part_00